MSIPPTIASEVARQHHDDLIARAERHRLARRIRVHRKTPPAGHSR